MVILFSGKNFKIHLFSLFAANSYSQPSVFRLCASLADFFGQVPDPLCSVRSVCFQLTLFLRVFFPPTFILFVSSLTLDVLCMPFWHSLCPWIPLCLLGCADGLFVWRDQELFCPWTSHHTWLSVLLNKFLCLFCHFFCWYVMVLKLLSTAGLWKQVMTKSLHKAGKCPLLQMLPHHSSTQTSSPAGFVAGGRLLDTWYSWTSLLNLFSSSCRIFLTTVGNSLSLPSVTKCPRHRGPSVDAYLKTRLFSGSFF